MYFLFIFNSMTLNLPIHITKTNVQVDSFFPYLAIGSSTFFLRSRDPLHL